MTTIIINSSGDQCVQSPLATKQDVNQLEHTIMAKVSELAAILNGINDEVNKAKTEILQKISDLEASLSDVELPADATAALDALKTSVQSVDDIVPDSVTPPPGEGTPPAAALAKSRKNTL